MSRTSLQGSLNGSLKNKVIAITGGGRGIGLAIAEALIAQGARVSIGDIDVALAEREAKRIGAHAGQLDVRDAASFAKFIAGTEAALGPLYALVNNAGIMPMGYFLDEAPALADAQIDINFRGVIHGMRLALPGLLARGSGHIINIASLAGHRGSRAHAAYDRVDIPCRALRIDLAGPRARSGLRGPCPA